jgi:nitrogen fixation protein NifX
MLRIAFATSDRKTVNHHFGGTEGLVIFDVSPGEADFLDFAVFPPAEKEGEVVRDGITGSVQDKVVAKLEFVKSCHAVYAYSIGSSSTRRLMQLGVQPVIVKEGAEILGLLNEISRALAQGGVAWIDKAKAKAILENKRNDSSSVDAGAARMTSKVGQETAL